MATSGMVAPDAATTLPTDGDRETSRSSGTMMWCSSCVAIIGREPVHIRVQRSGPASRADCATGQPNGVCAEVSMAKGGGTHASGTREPRRAVATTGLGAPEGQRVRVLAHTSTVTHQGCKCHLARKSLSPNAVRARPLPSLSQDLSVLPSLSQNGCGPSGVRSSAQRSPMSHSLPHTSCFPSRTTAEFFGHLFCEDEGSPCTPPSSPDAPYPMDFDRCQTALRHHESPECGTRWLQRN